MILNRIVLILYQHSTHLSEYYIKYNMAYRNCLGAILQRSSYRELKKGQ